MARAATAARPKPAPARPKPAPARPKAGPARPKPAPARTHGTPARHAARRRPAAAGRRGASTRRMSGPAAAPAVALPARMLRAPFARAARRRTSSLLDALLAGRGWIALVFVLLAGIVFFNVDLLQMNREIARNAERISALKQEIARNRLDVARLASSERIQESALELGLVSPAPGEVRYLKARPGLDASRAAKRITAPIAGYVPPAPVDPAPEPVADPYAAEPAPVDPYAAEPAPVEPAADPAATAAPAPTTASAPAG